MIRFILTTSSEILLISMFKRGYIFTKCQELTNGRAVLKITVTNEKRGSMLVMRIRVKGE